MQHARGANVDRKMSYPHFGDNCVENVSGYPHIGDNFVDNMRITFPHPATGLHNRKIHGRTIGAHTKPPFSNVFRHHAHMWYRAAAYMVRTRDSRHLLQPYCLLMVSPAVAPNDEPSARVRSNSISNRIGS